MCAPSSLLLSLCALPVLCLHIAVVACSVHSCLSRVHLFVAFRFSGAACVRAPLPPTTSSVRARLRFAVYIVFRLSLVSVAIRSELQMYYRPVNSVPPPFRSLSYCSLVQFYPSRISFALFQLAENPSKQRFGKGRNELG